MSRDGRRAAPREPSTAGPGSAAAAPFGARRRAQRGGAARANACRASPSPTSSSSCSIAAKTARATSRASFTDRIVEGAWEREGPRRNAGIAACRGEWILEIDADERVGPALAAEIRAVVASSAASWHLIPVDNYVGERLVRWGWGASFGRSAYAGLFRRGAKHWGDERVHPAVDLVRHAGADARRAPRAPCRPQHLRHAAPARPLHQLAGAGFARQRRDRQLRAQSAAASYRASGNAMSAAAAIAKARGAS